MPAKILINVLLPAPFSPARMWTSPARHSNRASRKTVTGPNLLVMPVIRTRGVGLEMESGITWEFAVDADRRPPHGCKLAPAAPGRQNQDNTRRTLDSS